MWLKSLLLILPLYHQLPSLSPTSSSPSPPSFSLLFIFCFSILNIIQLNTLPFFAPELPCPTSLLPLTVVPAAWTSHVQFSLVLQSPSQMSLPQIKWPVAKTVFIQTLMELCCFFLAFDILILYSLYILSPLLDGNPLKRFIFVSHMALRGMLCS